MIGNRPDQNVVAIEILSTDKGETFHGTMTYAGEGHIGLRAERIGDNRYKVENQWGDSVWHPGGIWVIGDRPDQPCVALNVTAKDDELTLKGHNTYEGEGPIGVRGILFPFDEN